MKPSDITLDMVRDAMERSAEWSAQQDGPKLGYWADAHTIVLVVHGYVGRGSWAERSASDSAAREKLGWSGRRESAPTQAQCKRVQEHLDVLVEEGKVLRRGEHGQTKRYAWLTQAMSDHDTEVAAARAKYTALTQELNELLGEDKRPNTSNPRVTAQFYRAPSTDAQVYLQLDEETARRVLDALKHAL